MKHREVVIEDHFESTRPVSSSSWIGPRRKEYSAMPLEMYEQLPFYGSLVTRSFGPSSTLMKLWEQLLRWPGYTIMSEPLLAETKKTTVVAPHLCSRSAFPTRGSVYTRVVSYTINVILIHQYSSHHRWLARIPCFICFPWHSRGALGWLQPIYE